MMTRKDSDNSRTHGGRASLARTLALNQEAMIEEFSLKYEHFFDEPRYAVRWQRLKSLYSEDYGSFRVLFVVETMGLLNRWTEPTVQKLNSILCHQMAGGRFAMQIG